MPDAARPIVNTYRLQLHEGFPFAAAAEVAPRLAALGATHLYLSPILQATPGSMHGYDVVDHTRISSELGGEEGFRSLATTAQGLGMGVIVDVVPNHVALPTPESLNPRLWSLLREGPESSSARWFDVDWSSQEGSILVAVLGDRIGRCLERGEITLQRDGDEPVVRYYDHVLPVRPGTAHLPLPELLDRQWYRLAYWRVSDEELNYRRFFDVDTLAGVRAEDPAVFAEMHEVLLRLHREGLIDGFRIDHPDGLADPRGYLQRLGEATGGAWVVAEKILEGDEHLPDDWACDGTTGYDALTRVTGLLTDPSGAEGLGALWAPRDPVDATFDAAAERATRDVLAGSLHAEVNRLVELVAGICHADLMLRDVTRRGIEEALIELLVEVPVYRAYVTPGEEPPPESVAHIEEAVERAAAGVPHREEEVRLLGDLALGRRGRDRLRDEFCIRFQQTTGPVMAKGVEDTALYRWFRLVALNEVGGSPGALGMGVDRVHGWAERQQAREPRGMTTLSTHDTKRSEDVRARLMLLSEVSDEWAAAVESWEALAAHHETPGVPVHPADAYLMWQTIVGAWPLDGDRLVAYMIKALREGKQRTAWTAPDEAYETAVESLSRAVLDDPELTAGIAAFVDRLAPAFRANVLAQKLVQLTLPGVADTYQGCEVVSLSLVDPDNRRPVDHAHIATRLERLDAGAAPADLHDEKLLVTSRALHLRRERPEWFAHPDAGYQPLPTGSAHAFGFVRADRVAALVTRLPATLEREGGWGPATIGLPPGRWRDLLTRRDAVEGLVPLDGLLDRLPVALLVRED